MRTLTVCLTLCTLAFAGCLDDDAGSTQSIDETPQWLIAQADATAGDVAGFAYTLAPLPECGLDMGGPSVAVHADEDGAQADAGNASAKASAEGAMVHAPCVQVHADSSGAQASVAGSHVVAGYDGVSVEVVPDTSALGELSDFAFMVYKIQDGTATHVMTVLSSDLTRIEQETNQIVDRAVREAEVAPLVVPLEGLDLKAGDRIGFVMAAVKEGTGELEAAVDQGAAVAGSAVAVTGLPVEVPDYGFAFRLADSATASAQRAGADFAALAQQAQDEATGVAKDAAEHVDAKVQHATSVLDMALATGKAEAMGAVGQVQGYSLGFFAEFTGGALQGLENVRFLTDAIDLSYGLDGGLKPLAAAEEVTIGYSGPFVDGFGIGVGAYTAAENGNVDWSLDATVHDVSVSESGSITAVGPISNGIDPAYVLAGTGEAAQSLAFKLQRTAQDEAMVLFSLHADLAASLQDLMGATEVLPIGQVPIPEGIPLALAGTPGVAVHVASQAPALVIDAPGYGPIHIIGL